MGAGEVNFKRPLLHVLRERGFGEARRAGLAESAEAAAAPAVDRPLHGARIADVEYDFTSGFHLALIAGVQSFRKRHGPIDPYPVQQLSVTSTCSTT